MKETLRANLLRVASPPTCVVLGAVLASVLTSLVYLERGNSGHDADGVWMKKQLDEEARGLNELRKDVADLKTQSETTRQKQAENLAETASLRTKLDDTQGHVIGLTAERQASGSRGSRYQESMAPLEKPKETKLTLKRRRPPPHKPLRASSAREIARLRKEIARLKRENAKLRARLNTVIPVGLSGA